jgi:hypothetical protein
MHTFTLLALVLVGTSVHAQNNALLLFGGEGHKTFLGCINCGKYDSGSVCNKYGDLGSKYSSNSIWNKYGDFGGKYSDRSPWNRYASNPPAIVERVASTATSLLTSTTRSERR